jgi:hypothetical protein
VCPGAAANQRRDEIREVLASYTRRSSAVGGLLGIPLALDVFSLAAEVVEQPR